MRTRIKEVRKLKGLTQVEFGKAVGVSGQYVTMLESGERSPSEALVQNICHEFNIRYDWLVNGEEPMMIPQDKYDELIQTILHNKSEFMRSAVMTISRFAKAAGDFPVMTPSARRCTRVRALPRREATSGGLPW